MALCVTDGVRLSAVEKKLAEVEQLLRESRNIIKYMNTGAPDIPLSGNDYLVEPACKE